jgi:hypothetical protein
MRVQLTIEGQDLPIIHGSNLVDEEFHFLGVQHRRRINLGVGHGCQCSG